MRKHSLSALALLALVAAAAPAADWPQWRGPELRGTSPETKLPVKWSTSEGLAWTLALPTGSGSTPIISADRIYLNVAEGDLVSLWCLDRKSGAATWKEAARPLGGPRAQEAQHVDALAGHRRQARLRDDGTGRPQGLHGRRAGSSGRGTCRRTTARSGRTGATAARRCCSTARSTSRGAPRHEDRRASYLVGLDAATGKNRFRVERPTRAQTESPDAYTTPTVARRGDKVEIVVTGGDGVVTGHDPATGRELWRADGLNPDNSPFQRIVASPVAAGDLVVAPTRVKPMLVLRAFGSGDVTKSVLWSFDRGPDVPTPATDGTLLYVLTDRACSAWTWRPARPTTGRSGCLPAPQLLAAARGRQALHHERGCFDERVKAGTSFRALAENVLEGFTVSSPAAASGQLFIRTASHLYAIGPKAR